MRKLQHPSLLTSTVPGSVGPWAWERGGRLRLSVPEPWYEYTPGSG